MPLSDELLQEGNPSLPATGVEPYLGSPAPMFDSNPVYPTITFDGLKGTGAEQNKTLGGPSLQDWLKPSNKPSQVASPLIGVDELAANRRYAMYKPGVDNEEIAAQGQSTGAKLANSILKGLGTAVGTFAQGFFTIPDTISAVASKDMSKLYDNDAERAIDTWKTNMEDTLPNYYSNWETEHPFLSAIPFSGGAANFWGDKVIKNLGFTAGAIASAAVQDLAIGAISGGIGELPLLANQIGRASLWLSKIASGTDKVGDVLKLGSALEKSGESLLVARNLARAAAATKVGNSFRYGVNLYSAARTEGAIEARQGYDDVSKTLTDQFKKEHNGLAPEGANAQKIHDFALSSANVRFGVNMALLTVSDAVQFDNFLRPFAATKKAAFSLGEGAGKIAIKDGAIDTIEAVVPKSIGGKIWSKVQAKIPNILSEGVYEEGGQYAAEVGSANYYKDKYNGKISGNLQDVIAATGQGLAAQFGSEKGWESIFLGAITAGISSGIMGIGKGAARDAQTQAVLSTLNAQTITGSLSGNFADTAKAVSIKAEMDKAVKTNNIFAYKNFKHDLFYNFIQSGNKAGRFDVRTEQIKMLKDLPQAEFEKMYGMEFNDANRRTADSYVEALLKKANNIKSSLDSINDVFENPFRRITNSQEPEDMKEFLNHELFEQWKTELGHFSSLHYDSDVRLNDIRGEVAKISPWLNLDVLDEVGNKQGLNRLLNSYTGAMVNLEATKELATNAGEKARIDKEIKYYEGLAKRIDGFLTTGKDFQPLFTDLVNFEANGRVAETVNSVPKEKVNALMNYAYDLKQLKDRKRFASDAWDYLTSENGLEKYLASGAKQAGQATPVAAPVATNPATNAPVVTTPPPPAANTSTPGNTYLERVTRSKDDGITKTNNNGVDEFSGNAYAPDGTAVPFTGATEKEVQDAINAFYKAEQDAEKEEKRRAAELLQIQQDLDKQNASFPPTGAPNDTNYSGDRAKLLINIASTTANPVMTPEHTRFTKFLNNFDEISNNNKRPIKVITVTSKNEAALGLTGLTAYKMAGETDIDSADRGFIATVFVEELKDGVHFLDESGKRIGKLGEATDINSIIYSTLTSTRLTYTDKNDGSEKPLYVQKPSDQGTDVDYQNAWRKERENILNEPADSYKIYDFNVSRGVAIENVDAVTGAKERNPIVGTLISEKDSKLQGIIQIPTTGTLTLPNGESVKFPNGRPVLVHGSTVQFLNNRNLTSDEVNTIYKVLDQIVKEPNKSNKFTQGLEYLHGLLYWGTPRSGKTGAVNQIWFDKGQLHIGPSFSVRFNKDGIKNNEAGIKDALAKVYNNVNANKLSAAKFNLPYEEITDVAADGSFVTKTWPTYQEFLLSPRENAPLSTTVASKKEAGYNYKGKYITITTNLDVQDSRVLVKKAPSTSSTAGTAIGKLIKNTVASNSGAPATLSVPTVDTTETTKVPITEAGGFTFDGITQNIFETKSGYKLAFTATLNENDSPLISPVENKEYQRLMDYLATQKNADGTEKYPSDEDKKTIAINVLYQPTSQAIIDFKNQPAVATTPVVVSTPQASPAVVNNATSTVASTPTAASILAAAKAAMAGQANTGTNNSEYRRIADSISNVEVENWDVAETWMKENLPQVPITRVKHLIRATGGGYAWGVFQDAAIHVFENAEIGTTYHEAFHAVWTLFATKAERASMTAEFKARKGQFFDRTSQSTIDYSKATNTQMKEALAEEFRDNIQTGKNPVKDAKGISRILKFFVDLINTVRNFFKGGVKVEDFFKRIKGGQYKNTPINTRNISEAEYSLVDGWNETTSHDVLQAITSKFIQEAYADKIALVEMEGGFDTRELYNKVYKGLEKEFNGYFLFMGDRAEKEPSTAPVIYQHIEQTNAIWEDIKANWGKLTADNNKFLRTFGLVNTQKMDENALDNNREENYNNDEADGRGDFLVDVMTIDAKKNASTAIHMLFGTLIQTVRPTQTKSNTRTVGASVGEVLPMPTVALSSIGQQQLVNSAKAFNHIMNTVSSTTTLNDMVKKTVELAKEYPDYVKLFTRLKGDRATGTIPYDKLDVNDWKLLVKFFDVFAKQRPQALIQVVEENGATYTINANFNDATRSQVSLFINQMKTKAKDEKSLIAFNRHTKTYDIKEKLIKAYPTRTIEDKIRLLNDLGLDFQITAYNALTPTLTKKFNSAVSSLISQLTAENQVMTFKGSILSISGPLNTIAEIMVRTNGDMSESTFSNTNREKVQASVQHNYASLFFADFNNAESLAELYMKFPQLLDVWSQDSEMLKAGGRYFDEDGVRNSEALVKVGYIDGTQNKAGKAQQTSQLSLINRTVQEINQNLSGRYFGLVPADSKTEWLLDMGNFVDYSEMTQAGVDGKIMDRMLAYLKTEILLAQNGERLANTKNAKAKSNQLRFFKDIINSDDLEAIQFHVDELSTPEEIDTYINDNAAIKADINAFIDARTAELRKMLWQSDIIEIESSKDETYRWKFLDDSFKTANKLGALNADQINNIIKMRTVNYIVSNIEMHKVLFGDPALINDPTKRIKSYWSGTHTPIHDEVAFDNYHNVKMNLVEEVQLQKGDPGYHKYKNYMKTATLATVKSHGEVFQDNDEADAQTWMRDTAYREFMQKNGYEWTAGQEKQFQYEMAWTRNYLYSIGVYKDYSPRLKELDREWLDAGNPSSGVFNVIKPKGSGLTNNTEYMDMYLDKTSAAPIFLRHITDEGKRSPNLVKMYLKMFDQDVDYVIMDSGRKVGAKALHSIYNADGAFNEEPFSEDTFVEIPFRNMGIQQETSGNKVKGTLGSQLTKHITADLMDNSIPIDFEKTDKEWDQLSEEEKEKASPIYVEVKKNQQLLQDLAEDGYEQLLDKLGIVETEEGFTMTDARKVAAYLNDELTRRATDDNTIKGIEINPETGEFNIPLEASPRYLQIKNILYALVDRNIGSPKVSGGAKIMQSSLMWEEGNREPDAKNGGYRVSGVLKYYTKDEPWMEVMLPYWFGQQLRKAGFEGSDSELIAQLHESGVLDGMGFRIPTQKLSSIDRIRVARFLPQEMGPTVVVPAELVSKTGGDFDVDKMNTYLKNVVIDKSGKIKAIAHKGDKATTKAFYEAEFEKLLAQSKSNSTRFLTAMRYAIQDAASSEDMQEYANMFDEANTRIDKYDDVALQAKLKKVYVASMYRKAVENGYFESLERLASTPKNFDRFMSPNSAKELKQYNKDLRALKLTPEELSKQSAPNNHSLLITPSYMAQVRHNFMIGKGGLGIANIAQTNHSLNQRSTIFIDTDKLGELSATDQKYIGTGKINLPHNTITIGGKNYATLSGRTDKEDRFISDKVSQYVDGFVDIAKDTFLIELGATPQTVSVYLLLEKLGVPSKQVIMFMNQPIIKEFVGVLEHRGWSSLLNDSAIKDVLTKFPVSEGTQGEMNLDMATLEGTISKYYREKDKLSNEENLNQQFVLQEMLKYAAIAGHLFDTIRGSNYDTANFNDSNLIDMKDIQTQQAREANILSGLSAGNRLPAVDAILETSFIGKRKEFTDRARNAISTAIPIKIDRGGIRSMLSTIKGMFSRKDMFKNERTQLSIARGVEASFIDFLIQTKLGFTYSAPELLRDEETAVAYKLNEFKASLDKDSDLYNNIILKELYSSPTDRQWGPKNVKLNMKDNAAYTSNLYTGALRELRDNPNSKSLYESLMRAAILQSGVKKSPFSFTHLIPVEDYARIFAPIMRRMDSYTDLNVFRDEYMYFRNNWKNEDVVPTLAPKWFEKTGQMGIPEGYFDPFSHEFMVEMTSPLYYNVPKSIQYITGKKGKVTDFIAVSQKYNSKQLAYPVIKVQKTTVNPITGYEYTDRDKAIMIKKGDFSFRAISLYALVKDGDTPLTVEIGKLNEKTQKDTRDTVAIYKQINAWGDGDNAQEYYSTPVPSVYDNGTTRMEREFTDEEIANAFYGRKDVSLPQSSTPVVVKEDVVAEEAEAEVVGTATTIAEITKPINFESITIEDVKRGGKKDIFPITSAGEVGEIEGYKVNVPSQPNLELYVRKIEGNWQMADAKSGKSIGNAAKTAKDAISNGVDAINGAIKSTSPETIEALNGLGLNIIEDLENKGIIETKDCE